MVHFYGHRELGLRKVFFCVEANRPKSKSNASTNSSKSSNKEAAASSAATENTSPTDTEFIYEQNETITRIEELLEFLTLETPGVSKASEDGQSILSTATTHSDTTSNLLNAAPSGNNNQTQQQLPNNINQLPNYSYVELLALYDRERTVRLDLESNYSEKSKESNKQVCS